jgi:hypothetical protein
VPWCPRCGTALSSHELAQGYEDVKDLSVYAKFKLKNQENTYVLAWTTTPWTLPGNIALAVGEEIEYVKAKVGNEFLILAESKLVLLGESVEVIEKIKGKDGKGCWKGYRYAGTENGKDKCVPVSEGEIGLSDILARELFKLQGKISDDLFYKLRKAINSQDPAALAKAKEIMSRIKPEDERIYMGEGEGQCPECGCKMEGQMCNECGYMEEAATFTNKYNDDPKLKGGQKDLPDEVQAKIVTKEGEDHEVSMAQASLKSIISSASQLMAKLGDDERDIPGWIQDHITNSENFIDQANQGFHELEPSNNPDEINESNNPEGDALVLRFLQGIAKKYNYPVSHAAMFVKERINKLGY